MISLAYTRSNKIILRGTIWPSADLLLTVELLEKESELVKLHIHRLHLKWLKIITEQLQRLFVRSVFLPVIFFGICSVFSQFNSVFEVIGLVVFLIWIAICFFQLQNQAGKQIRNKLFDNVGGFDETRENKEYRRSLDVIGLELQWIFMTSRRSRRLVDCHLHADFHGSWRVCEFLMYVLIAVEENRLIWCSSCFVTGAWSTFWYCYSRSN